MTDLERRDEWIRFYAAAPDGYRYRALQAVLAADGEKMLGMVLKKLDLEKSVDLIKDWS